MAIIPSVPKKVAPIVRFLGYGLQSYRLSLLVPFVVSPSANSQWLESLVEPNRAESGLGALFGAFEYSACSATTGRSLVTTLPMRLEDRKSFLRHVFRKPPGKTALLVASKEPVGP